MKNFSLIFRHYLKRAMTEPIGMLVLTGLPLAMIIILGMVYNNPDVPMAAEEFDASTHIARFMVIMFQLLGGSILLDWIYLDFKSDRRWRLNATPMKKSDFIIPATAASWLFSIIQGTLIIVVSYFTLGVYWGNIPVLIAVMFCVSVLGQLLFLIFAPFFAKKGTTEAVVQGVIWVMVIIGGMFWGTGGEGLTARLARIPTPISLAERAMNYAGTVSEVGGGNMSGALWAVLGLFVTTIAVAAVAILVNRRKSFDNI